MSVHRYALSLVMEGLVPGVEDVPGCGRPRPGRDRSQILKDCRCRTLWDRL